MEYHTLLFHNFVFHASALERGMRGVFSCYPYVFSLRHPSMFLAWMPAFAGMTMMFLSTFTFASNTTNNLYDANGHLIASCGDKSGCSYLVYKGLSQGGSIKAGKYKHYLAGPQGKLAVIDKDETQSSQTLTWLTTDFHDTVMVSSVGNTPQQNTLDAFGNDLQPESSAKEKIYTDKHPVDSAKSLYNFNARFYDSEIGRFITVDPLEQANLWLKHYGKRYSL